MARKHEVFELSDADRKGLEALLRSPKTPQSVALRARILLMTADGSPVEEV